MEGLEVPLRLEVRVQYLRQLQVPAAVAVETLVLLRSVAALEVVLEMLERLLAEEQHHRQVKEMQEEETTRRLRTHPAAVVDQGQSMGSVGLVLGLFRVMGEMDLRHQLPEHLLQEVVAAAAAGACKVPARVLVDLAAAGMEEQQFLLTVKQQHRTQAAVVAVKTTLVAPPAGLGVLVLSLLPTRTHSQRQHLLAVA